MLIIKTSYFDVETTKQMWHVKKAMNTYSTSSQGFKGMQQHDTEKCMHSIFNRQGVCTKNTFCWVHYYFNAKTFLNLWSNRRPFLAPLAYCRIQIIRFISGHEYNLLIILQDVSFMSFIRIFGIIQNYTMSGHLGECLDVLYICLIFIMVVSFLSGCLYSSCIHIRIIKSIHLSATYN